MKKIIKTAALSAEALLLTKAALSQDTNIDINSLDQENLNLYNKLEQGYDILYNRAPYTNTLQNNKERLLSMYTNYISRNMDTLRQEGSLDSNLETILIDLAKVKGRIIAKKDTFLPRILREKARIEKEYPRT